MRKMSDGVEAALHCVLVLAQLTEGCTLAGKDLAVLHGLSQSYLLKHLRSLVAADVVKAISGPRGGYCLARQPQAITMLDIVEAIDGKEPAFQCREIRRRGPNKSKDPCIYNKDCFIKSRMVQAEEVWRQALRVQTIADLLKDGKQIIDPHNKKAVGDYITKAQR